MGKEPDILDLGSWFILRCASADTLKVADHLQKRGFDVWTPIERKYGRKPRTRAPFDKEFALMPSYLFAAMDDLPSLQQLADLPTSDTPRFTLFRYAGGVPLIDDNQLDALRAEESRLQRVYEKHSAKGKTGPKFEGGEVVRLQEGGFAGLEGTVIEQQGQYTLVSLAGFHQPIKIASLLLLDEARDQKAA
jgi:transcription antitermination factor NusG